jgi:hypothetical protein
MILLRIFLLFLVVITNVSVIAFLAHGSLAAMATIVEGRGIAERGKQVAQLQKAHVHDTLW